MKDVFSLAENLSTSILFTFGCLLFTIFLSIIYFSKEKQSDLRSKLYRIILSLVVFILSTEFIYLLCLGYSNSEFLITSVKFLHWLSFILWVGVYCIYCVVYMQKLQYNSFGELFRESKNSSFLLIVTCILLLGYAIAPKETIDLNLIKCIASHADYIVLVFLTCMCAYVLVCSYALYKQYPLRRKIAITLIMFVMLVMLVLQVMFNDISVYVICCSLQVFFLYFIIENPDIHLAREIEGLKADIDKSNKSKTDFLSNMSHEIRTPMNAIIGFSDSLLNSPKFDENTARNDIQSIATAGTNLVDIINNILDISKIESGNDTLDNKEFSIAKIVKELGSIIESRIGNNPVKLYIELDEQIPSKVYGDSTKIYQILLNITNNAVKYTEVGKIKLSIVPEKTGNDAVLLHIKISDTGYGIKKEDFDKIFEKFSRLDSAVSKEIEGTGLGLVITKKFVDLMGGKIWFTSEFEVGTTFYVDLPLKVIDPTPIGSVTQDTSVQRVRNFLDCSDFTALVVDDSRLNLKVAERLLKKYNFNVDVAQSGKDCIYKYKYGNHYDIIFLDHMMPEMDGIETVRILRRLDDYETPPIIALTANAMNGMEEKYLSEGFDYYLPMPINTQELDKIIHKFFENKTVTLVDDNVKTHHENASAVPEVKVDKPIEKPSKVIEEIKHIDMENVKPHDNSEVKVAAPVTEEKPVEVKEKIKEETKVEKKPAESATETKEEVQPEEKVEEKAEVTTEPEVKEETKVEEKPAEPATETKEEVQPEEKVEEKAEVTTEPEVKEETKVEEKPAEPATEAKVEEKPTEPVTEAKEDVKPEEKVEEKAEVTTEPEVKEETKVEEKPTVPVTEVKEEAKPESTEASNNDVSTDTVEIATDKSDDAMLAYLKEHGVNMDNSLELLGDMEMYNMTMGDFIADVEAKWDRINQFKEASDMPNYAIEVHSLKSDCKYLGFMDLADISYQHELKSKENDVNFVNEHFDELVNEYNKVIKFVKTYIARYQLG
ncbi:MAG: ATP-binding protein [Bacilli bacterium]|nr:ATP-binding protein [Bacilli bacterium]